MIEKQVPGLKRQGIGPCTQDMEIKEISVASSLYKDIRNWDKDLELKREWAQVMEFWTIEFVTSSEVDVWICEEVKNSTVLNNTHGVTELLDDTLADKLRSAYSTANRKFENFVDKFGRKKSLLNFLREEKGSGLMTKATSPCFRPDLFMNWHEKWPGPIAYHANDDACKVAYEHKLLWTSLRAEVRTRIIKLSLSVSKWNAKCKI